MGEGCVDEQASCDSGGWECDVLSVHEVAVAGRPPSHQAPAEADAQVLVETGRYGRGCICLDCAWTYGKGEGEGWEREKRAVEVGREHICVVCDSEEGAHSVCPMVSMGEAVAGCGRVLLFWKAL